MQATLVSPRVVHHFNISILLFNSLFPSPTSTNMAATRKRWVWHTMLHILVLLTQQTRIMEDYVIRFLGSYNVTCGAEGTGHSMFVPCTGITFAISLPTKSIQKLGYGRPENDQGEAVLLLSVGTI